MWGDILLWWMSCIYCIFFWVKMVCVVIFVSYKWVFWWWKGIFIFCLVVIYKWCWIKLNIVMSWWWVISGILIWMCSIWVWVVMICGVKVCILNFCLFSCIISISLFYVWKCYFYNKLESFKVFFFVLCCCGEWWWVKRLLDYFYVVYWLLK